MVKEPLIERLISLQPESRRSSGNLASGGAIGDLSGVFGINAKVFEFAVKR
jgi:hypothetical protein